MNSSIDSAGHITLAVSDFKKSKLFYDLIFQKLKIKTLVEKETSAAYEILPEFALWIKQAKKLTHAHEFHAPGFHHLCFKAKSKKEVDKFYEFLLNHKIKIYDTPQSYPKYTEDYYAVFFADPDGLKLELAYY